jgi:hypothetical protein
MKTCEICRREGRIRYIRTGRKYCWEHRHTSQAEGIRGDNLVNKAKRKYWERFIWKFYLIWAVLIFLIVIISETTLHITTNIGVCFTTFFIFAIIFLFAVVLLKFFRKKILSSEKCEEYVKNYLRKH